MVGTLLFTKQWKAYSWGGMIKFTYVEGFVHKEQHNNYWFPVILD